ncbi:hypothetical protein DS745_02035 [Anaerobacillus alkaliphilus]|uniref:Endonuclease/exonuclease/phosphatase domain-containing protein n=1 Tax=Anaerobacillus alkaliphilus TaxID=1548597 RepID=A0A4Q0VYL6_9BACI|nr:endonuclease/exonuclease/phosphatase family protein [Anaerobacillus alkaliphilus]RXJ04188.1 hypothetical protein DS745_02035 [Anaerobacillus alkaliphilus]
MGKRFLGIIIVVILVISASTYFHEKLKAIYTWQTLGEHHFNGELTVVTYNIRYGKGLDGQVNLNRVIATLKDVNADIISLQEVERYSIRSNFYDQVRQIARDLDMNVLYFPSLAYPGFYYGNVILSRFPIIDSEIIPFITSRENRSAIIGKILLPNSEEIYVINTHLGLDKAERLKAIHRIHQFIEGVNKPVFLTGDLNSTPSMMEYEIWTNYLQKSNEGIPLQTFYKKDWQIDYIFHSHHFTVTNVNVHKSDASDHFPVVAMFRLGKK